MLVLLGVGVLVTIGAIMSRVRTQPTLRGPIEPEQAAAVIDTLRTTLGPAIRISELAAREPEVIEALVDDGRAFDRRYEFITLRRDANRWRIDERRPWP